LSVRALHHYEAAGLVSPARTDTQHRLYSASDVDRLRRIANLRRLGLSLEEVRACLLGESLTPRRLLELRLAELHERQAELERDALHLSNVLLAADASGDAGPFDLWTAVDTLALVEKHLEPDQYATWTRARRELGQGGIAERERLFRELVDALRAAMTRGADPSDDVVQDLARRWETLAQESYCHDDDLRTNMAAAVSQVPGLRERLGTDPELLRYVGRALAQL
jgi:DNA-binding transcriptional MerR regulator